MTHANLKHVPSYPQLMLILIQILEHGELPEWLCIEIRSILRTCEPEKLAEFDLKQKEMP